MVAEFSFSFTKERKQMLYRVQDSKVVKSPGSAVKQLWFAVGKSFWFPHVEMEVLYLPCSILVWIK
jgi:hypothetical protein